MCTVTYLPFEGGYIITSNRDERVTRETLPPRKYRRGDESVFFPMDKEKGGTWVATSGQGFTLCLLNGAFEKHISAPPYRQSRGKVVTDFFEVLDADRFCREYNFTGIEPFTLLVAHKGSLRELRWDGTLLHQTSKAADSPHIWSSATLYAPEVITLREQWFEAWLKAHPSYQPPDIIDFHHFGGSGSPEHDLIMEKNSLLKTVSITSIVLNGGTHTLWHKDLNLGKEYSLRILNLDEPVA